MRQSSSRENARDIFLVRTDAAAAVVSRRSIHPTAWIGQFPFSASFRFEHERRGVQPGVRRLTACRRTELSNAASHFLLMQSFFVTGFMLLIAVAAVLIYVARPFETPEQYAQRLCRASPPTGISY